MKRILITNFHPQRDGGGGHMRFIRTILDSPLRREFEFAVAAPEESAVWNTGKELGYPTFTCSFPGNLKEIPQMVGAVRRFAQISRDWRPDLVHVNGSRDQAIVVLWKKFCAQDTPCLRGHLAVRCIPNHIYNRWSYQRMVQGHVYVGHSAKNISWAGKYLKTPHARVIPVGVDVQFWTPQSKDPQALARFAVGDTDFVFGSHAGMGGHKRTDLFLRAAALAKRDGARPFRILLKGKEEEIRSSSELAHSLGLTDVVYVRHEPDPRAYLSLIDVGFILSESIEAISYAARELMAMGKPLISSNYAGLVENVDDRLNGRLVECGDVHGVAEAIRWFLALSPEELAQLGKRAREKAERVFSVEGQIRGMGEYYRAVLAGFAAASEPAVADRAV